MTNSSLLGFAIVSVCIFLPLSLGSIIVGSMSNPTCNYWDPVGLDLKIILIGLGIVNMIIYPTILILIFINLMTSRDIYIAIIYSLLFLHNFFLIVWFFLSSITIFRSNYECVKINNTLCVYSVLMWVLMPLSMISTIITSYN